MRKYGIKTKIIHSRLYLVGQVAVINDDLVDLISSLDVCKCIFHHTSTESASSLARRSGGASRRGHDEKSYVQRGK